MDEFSTLATILPAADETDERPAWLSNRTQRYAALCRNPRKLRYIKCLPRREYSNLVWFAVHLNPAALLEVDHGNFDEHFELLQRLSPPFLAFVDPAWLQPNEYAAIAMRCVRAMPSEFEHVRRVCMQFERIARMAVAADGTMIQFVDDVAQYNKLVEIAIENTIEAVQYVNWRRFPPTMAAEMLRGKLVPFWYAPSSDEPYVHLLGTSAWCEVAVCENRIVPFRFARELPETLENVERVFVVAIQTCPRLIRYVDQRYFSFEKHINLVAWALSHDGMSLAACRELSVSAYQWLVFIAVRQNGRAFELIDFRFVVNELDKFPAKFIEKALHIAVDTYGAAIRHFDCGPEIVFAAVRNDPCAIEYVRSYHLSRNEYTGLVIDAARRCPRILELIDWAHFNACRMNELVEALRLPDIIRYLGVSRKKYIRRALREDPTVIRFIHVSYFQRLVDSCLEHFRSIPSTLDAPLLTLFGST